MPDLQRRAIAAGADGVCNLSHLSDSVETDRHLDYDKLIPTITFHRGRALR